MPQLTSSQEDHEIVNNKTHGKPGFKNDNKDINILKKEKEPKRMKEDSDFSFSPFFDCQTFRDLQYKAPSSYMYNKSYSAGESSRSNSRRPSIASPESSPSASPRQELTFKTS
ncbi:hypothetical protein BGX26_008831 [Mortierella sp. AD094]|nr:hypothetical protein BGX26_008831 [Mortierella sp. AD094]